MRILIVAAAFAAASLLSSGCGMDKQSELQEVARDWCMTIRASQVIPVYPLTEDLQPGDLFLVSQPVAEQHRQYQERGFLPLDHHLARLNPDGYTAFYKASFGIGGDQVPVPKTLLHMGENKDKAWAAAPQAGFPSYSVSVRRGSGLSAAVPVQGVPIGLSLLGSDAADISVSIDKARTYGLDTMALHHTVLAWASQPLSRAFLSQVSSTAAHPQYLRVVGRVYLTGRLVTTITSARSGSAGLSAGAPKPVDLLTLDPAATTKPGTVSAYTDGLSKLNTALSEALKVGDAATSILPGATVKVVAASSHSVTVAEDFIDRPLVIGYLGFDYAILPGGEIGPPIATHDVVSHAASPAHRPFFTGTQQQLKVLSLTLRDRGDADKTFPAAAELMDAEFRAAYTRERASRQGPTADYEAWNSALVDYLAADPTGHGSRYYLAIAALQSASTIP